MFGIKSESLFSQSKELERQIDEFDPDIVLTWMNRATLILPPRGNFIRVGRLGGYYNLKYYRHCDHLVANTIDIVNYLKSNGWNDERVHYLPNFVTEKRVPAIERKVFYTPDHVPLIFALGRFHENKAFDILCEAMAQLPNAYLWLAGDGDLRKILEEQVENLGIKPRVRFLGWRQDVEALFAAADIFVCPSRYEPLGNVVIEAWAQGVPVVAADSLGPGTLIRQGETGILVPINDVNALAKALKRMISDDGLRHRLVDQGKAVYDSTFTEKLVVDKYLKCFEAITS